MSNLNGIFPVVANGTAISVEGKTYRFRRLGLKDLTDLLGIVNDTVAFGYARGKDKFEEVFAPVIAANQEESNLSLPQKTKTMQMIIITLFGIDVVQPRIYEWLASTLGKETKDVEGTLLYEKVSRAQLEDPGTFPLDSALDIVSGIVAHPDLESFLAKLRSQVGLAVEKVTRMLGAQTGTEQNNSPSTQD